MPPVLPSSRKADHLRMSYSLCPIIKEHSNTGRNIIIGNSSFFISHLCWEAEVRWLKVHYLALAIPWMSVVKLGAFCTVINWNSTTTFQHTWFSLCRPPVITYYQRQIFNISLGVQLGIYIVTVFFTLITTVQSTALACFGIYQTTQWLRDSSRKHIVLFLSFFVMLSLNKKRQRSTFQWTNWIISPPENGCAAFSFWQMHVMLWLWRQRSCVYFIQSRRHNMR